MEQYREMRVLIYPPAAESSGTEVTWAISALTMRNKVPHGHLHRHGKVDPGVEPSDPHWLPLVLEDLSRSLRA